VDFLMDEIVHTGKCIGCASCVTICPVDVFDYEDERPVDTRTAACVLCVLCAEVCPVLRPPDKDLPALVGYREPRIDDGYAPYSYGVYARTTRPDILERAQDGGVVSALLVHGLETGAWQGAILGDVIPDNRQVGRHKLAMTEHDVLSCAASRYTYSPNTLAFQEAMQRDVKPVAVVGVPCQIDGVRLQQNSSIRSAMSSWYRANVALTIGLFCSEAFTHESIAKLGELIGVDAERIENINIKGKVVVRLDDGEVINASLKQYRQWARPACLYCLDYSAEHADIGAGGIGLDGWTYTLIRTEAGHRAFQAAVDDGWIETRPLEDEPRGEFLLNKLSADKKLNRPLPAQMPTLQEREALGYIDPKTYYTKGPGAPSPSGQDES
jgi:coenzyme F420 hydrogenase subunit beta